MIMHSFRVTVLFVAVLAPCTGRAQTPAVKAAPADNSKELIDVVKVLAGFHLHQTYLNVGQVSEARLYGPYEASELARLLGTVVDPLDDVEKQLAKVAALKGLSRDDVAAIARLRKIATLLREQGTALQAYWDTGVVDSAKEYEAARKASWKELDALLDLEPKKGIAPPPREPGKNR